jgi:hypothetical protein
MEIPSNIPGAVMSMALFFVAAWIAGFLVRFIFVAPFNLFQTAKAETEQFKLIAQTAEKQLREVTADPDVVITSNTPPVVSEREAVAEAGDLTPGIFVIYRDVRIINRNHRPISLEINLRLKFGNHVHVQVDQREVDRWEALSDDDRDGRFGKIFPEVINVPGGVTEFGSLAYFLANENLAHPSFLALLSGVGADLNTAGDLIDGLRKELDIIEHISGRRDLIDSTGTFDHTMWKSGRTIITVE